MSTRIVLDASAALGLLLDHREADPLGAALASADLVMAPTFMLTEVANAIWKIGRADRLGDVDPQDLLRDASQLVDHLEPDASLHGEALSLALRLGHPVYDCLYLVLARREVATLLSRDKRLLALAERMLP
jgi:predicted nucleic acid-binding protein